MRAFVDFHGQQEHTSLDPTQMFSPCASFIYTGNFAAPISRLGYFAAAAAAAAARGASLACAPHVFVIRPSCPWPASMRRTVRSDITGETETKKGFVTTELPNVSIFGYQRVSNIVASLDHSLSLTFLVAARFACSNLRFRPDREPLSARYKATRWCPSSSFMDGQQSWWRDHGSLSHLEPKSIFDLKDHMA